jgi:hypothetical protein
MSKNLFPINEKGSWITDNPQHCYDGGLNDYLVKFLHKAILLYYNSQISILYLQD